MFHANAWGYPYLAATVGANIVFPGPHMDPESLLDALVDEGVTWTAGVPTIWLGILQLLDAHPGRWDISKLKGMLAGGSAVPRALIAAYKQRHGITVVQGWGMTETSPVASVTDFIGDLRHANEEEQFDFSAMAGIPLPLVEIRARDDEGNEIPWDADAMGELEVRGPWVASGYYDTPEQADRWTPDGWFKTGDICSIHPRGFIQIKDRSKDVIKSGGEWISSVELENALMAHPSVAEAAVIAIPDEKWDERPLAAIVLLPEKTATAEELREFLAGSSRSGGCPTGTSSSRRSPRRPSESSARPRSASSSPKRLRPLPRRSEGGRPRADRGAGRAARCRTSTSRRARCSTCARWGSTSWTCSSARGAIRNRRRCRRCSAARSRASSRGGA